MHRYYTYLVCEAEERHSTPKNQSAAACCLKPKAKSRKKLFCSPKKFGNHAIEKAKTSYYCVPKTEH